MIKRFIHNYVWFWKESFNFCEGYNKFWVATGCLFKTIPFCIDLEKWYRLSEKEREVAYAEMERML